jgi:hypothetical protein
LARITGFGLMASFTIQRSFSGTRDKIRRDLAAAFLDERPGSEDESHQYMYIVEKAAGGLNVLLVRPTWLNKGFDFEIRVPECSFRGKKGSWSARPSHDNLCSILHAVQAVHPKRFSSVQDGVRQAFACEDYGKSVAECADIPILEIEDMRGDAAADIAILIARWMFIEQDITYWTRSGRHMLMSKLRDEGLV